MARFHNIGGERVQFTSEEEAKWDAEEAAWEAGTYDRKMVEFRSKRNQLLAETDWMAFKDVTLPAAWKTYRQALRDITSGLDTMDKVNAVTWPTKPE
jgi:hypothetical protein